VFLLVLIAFVCVTCGVLRLDPVCCFCNIFSLNMSSILFTLELACGSLFSGEGILFVNIFLTDTKDLNLFFIEEPMYFIHLFLCEPLMKYFRTEIKMHYSQIMVKVAKHTFIKVHKPRLVEYLRNYRLYAVSLNQTPKTCH